MFFVYRSTKEEKELKFHFTFRSKAKKNYNRFARSCLDESTYLSCLKVGEKANSWIISFMRQKGEGEVSERRKLLTFASCTQIFHKLGNSSCLAEQDDFIFMWNYIDFWFLYALRFNASLGGTRNSWCYLEWEVCFGLLPLSDSFTLEILNYLSQLFNQ